MSIFRVIKNKNYTTISNFHLQDRQLSLKAKGLLTLILSLPDNWDFSIRGLAELSSDGYESTRNTLLELERYGYLKREQSKDEHGRFVDLIYNVFETSQNEDCSPLSENSISANKPNKIFNKLNTKKQITKKMLSNETNDNPISANNLDDDDEEIKELRRLFEKASKLT